MNRVLILFVVATALGMGPQQETPRKAIDGNDLRAFLVANAYLEKNTKGTPYMLEHYSVTFRGSGRFHFDPKLAPGEKQSALNPKKWGWPMDVVVELRSLKVTSVTVQP